MNAFIAFFMWLFGWALPGVHSQDAGAIRQITPVTSQSGASIDGYTAEGVNNGKNQQVTIIIYDDTHFGTKRR
ncbi:MAG: hypothetical protein NWR72_04815 [Bacteroidia bacterium]|nr:hypothetical protein [Bacteroidia bacterium]